MELTYDEPVRYPNECFWEIRNAVQYDTPQQTGARETYIAEATLLKGVGTMVKVRVAKLHEQCPMKMPLIEEGFARTFFYSRKYLMLLDVESEIYYRMVFNHSRNCCFKELNRVFDLKITPNNFREIVFINWQNNDHHWRLKRGFEIARIDLSVR